MITARTNTGEVPLTAAARKIIFRIISTGLSPFQGIRYFAIRRNMLSFSTKFAILHYPFGNIIN